MSSYYYYRSCCHWWLAAVFVIVECVTRAAHKRTARPHINLTTLHITLDTYIYILRMCARAFKYILHTNGSLPKRGKRDKRVTFCPVSALYFVVYLATCDPFGSVYISDCRLDDDVRRHFSSFFSISKPQNRTKMIKTQRKRVRN